MYIRWANPALQEFHDGIAFPRGVHDEAEEVHVHQHRVPIRICDMDLNLECGLPIVWTNLALKFLQTADFANLNEFKELWVQVRVAIGVAQEVGDTLGIAGMVEVPAEAFRRRARREWNIVLGLTTANVAATTFWKAFPTTHPVTSETQ